MHTRHIASSYLCHNEQRLEFSHVSSYSNTRTKVPRLLVSAGDLRYLKKITCCTALVLGWKGRLKPSPSGPSPANLGAQCDTVVGLDCLGEKTRCGCASRWLASASSINPRPLLRQLWPQPADDGILRICQMASGAVLYAKNGMFHSALSCIRGMLR